MNTAASTPLDTALWYTSRATGLVCLVLITVVMLLGAANSARFSSVNWPRFAIAAVHRNLTLVTVAFVVVHAATSVIDPYAGISWLNTLIPFTGSYEPAWLGLGAVALDLLLALVVSSLLRPRINPRVWRGIHWAAYLCWPVAVLHGFEIGGADSRLAWVRVLDVVCVLAVLAAVVWRATARHPDTDARKAPFQGIR